MPIDKTYEKVAIVGKNSITWKSIKESFVKHSIHTDEFSHKEINRINDELYGCIIIFSFSYKNKQNEFLLNCLAKAKKVIYISTVTTICAKENYFYRYPNAKLLAENYLTEKCNNRQKIIIKCGIIEGTNRLPSGRSFFTKKKFSNLFNRKHKKSKSRK